MPWVRWWPKGAAFPAQAAVGKALVGAPTGWSHPAYTSCWQSRLLTLPSWKCFNLRVKYCFTLCPAAQRNSSVSFHSYNKPPKQTAFKLCFQIRLDKEQAGSVWCSAIHCPSSASALLTLTETGLRASSLQLPLDWVDISPCIFMDTLTASSQDKASGMLKSVGNSSLEEDKCSLAVTARGVPSCVTHVTNRAEEVAFARWQWLVRLQGRGDSPTIPPKCTALVASRAGRRGGREGRWWKLPRSYYRAWTVSGTSKYK